MVPDTKCWTNNSEEERCSPCPPEAYTGRMRASKWAGEMSPTRTVQVAMGAPGRGGVSSPNPAIEWGVVKEELEL